jgi:signal transduction histidine kinase
VLNFETNPNGGLWMVTYGQMGTYRDGKFTPLIQFDKNVVTTALTNHPDGSLWFNQSQTLYQIKGKKIDSYELDNVTYIGRQIFIDRENNIWLGRNVDGLIRLVERRVENIVLEPELRQGKPIAVTINSIVEDRAGNIWMSANPHLYRWHNGKTEKIPDDLAKSPFAARGALRIDSAGTLWNATTEGLRSYKDGKLTIHQDISWKNSQAGTCLFEDSRKNLWFGNPEFGVFVSDGSKIIARYTKENGLIDNAVTFIKETRDGAIWLTTRGGISRLQNGQFTNWTTADGLSNDNVRDLYEDQDGTLWFGTYGGGLNRFRDGKFTPIMTKDGLYDDIVSRILTDDEDNFWLSGNRGIFTVNRQMLNDFADGKIKKVFCLSYNKADGMRTSETNGGYQNAGIRARDGKLWFPTIDGVVVIDPKKDKSPPLKPLLEEVLMETGLYKFEDKLELNYDNDDVEFHYTATGFRKPEQIRFRYRLLGFEDNEFWEEVGTRRTAYYPKIPPGEYTFQVIAANADGNWSAEIAELKVIVYPPIYLTWWFLTLSVLFVVCLIVLAFMYRTLQFEKAKRLREEFARRLLQAQENERRRFASEIHDNLGQQLLIIKNWALLCLDKIPKNNKVRGQINQIQETAEIALQDVRSIAKNLSPYHLDKAGLTNTIDFMIKQVAESSNLKLTSEIDKVDGILTKEAELNLYRIVQESLNNIIKHSQASKAKVVLKRNGNGLRLTVTDNGIGFQTAPDDYQRDGTGLNGMTERAKMLGGNLTVKSIPKKGTEIILELNTNPL